MCDDAYVVMNASTASPRLRCLLLRRAAAEHDGTSVRCIARTFRRPFRSVSDHSIAGGWRRVFGHSRRWHDHRPTAEMISVADVEYTIWSNGSFVRVQRTVVEPVVALPHIALSLRGVDACGRWRDIVDEKVGDRPRDHVYRAEPDRCRRRWHCDTDTPNGMRLLAPAPS